MSDEVTEKLGWLKRLKQGLNKTSTRLQEGITGLFTRRKLDEAALEELEELLIATDMGVKAASELTRSLSRQKFGKEVSDTEVREALAADVETLLLPVAKPFTVGEARPYIVLVVGVNGNGKTTTIAKLAAQLKSGHYKILLAAADTFRAAAVEQLKVWGERLAVPVVYGEVEADPASIAFQAVDRARAEHIDVVLIDTAGRLHNKANLMAELQKIVKVIKKQDISAPHQVLQVLDATTGQNAIAQVEAFHDLAKVSGLVVTKLDGTAKGGIVLALAEKFKLPIHAVGVGEGADDMKAFEARDFSRQLLGIE